MKISHYIYVGLLTVAIIGIGLAFDTGGPLALEETVKTTKKKQTNNVDELYIVNTTWELPKDLKEVSGIAWLTPHTFACVQDEDGIIFIYNTKSKSITNKVEFGESGDYEGIAIVDKDAFIMRSDGTVFEVTDFESKNKEVSSFSTGFSIKNNMETLTYNKETERLITVPKDEGLENDNFKSIYEIDIDTKKTEDTPFLKIDMNADAFGDFRKKKAEKTFNPSDAAIHPKTQDIYVLEGKNPKLVIFSSKGAIKKVIELNKDTFPQPEGITFSKDGILYISNEANKGPATLLEVSLK